MRGGEVVADSDITHRWPVGGGNKEVSGGKSGRIVVLRQLSTVSLGVGVKTQGRNPQTENGESQEGAVTSFGAWPILFGRVRPKRPRRN